MLLLMNMRKQMFFLPVLGVVEPGWGWGGFSCLRQCHLSSCDRGWAVGARAQMELCLHSCTCIVPTCTKCSCSMSGTRSLPSSAVTPVPLSFTRAPFPGQGGGTMILSPRVWLQQRLDWPCNGKKDSRAIFCKRQSVLEVNTAFQ